MQSVWFAPVQKKKEVVAYGFKVPNVSFKDHVIVAFHVKVEAPHVDVKSFQMEDNQATLSFQENTSDNYLGVDNVLENIEGIFPFGVQDYFDPLNCATTD